MEAGGGGGRRERARAHSRARARECICVCHDDMFMCVCGFVCVCTFKNPKSIPLYRREQTQQWKSYNRSSTSPLSRSGNTHAHLFPRKMMRVRYLLKVIQHHE
jgi:hypothetical protein